MLIIGRAPDTAAQPGGGPGVVAAAPTSQSTPGVVVAAAAAHGGLGVGGVGVGGRLDGGGRAAALLGSTAARLGEGTDNALHLRLTRHLGQDGGVAQHTVVQGTLSLEKPQDSDKVPFKISSFFYPLSGEVGLDKCCGLGL